MICIPSVTNQKNLKESQKVNEGLETNKDCCRARSPPTRMRCMTKLQETKSPCYRNQIMPFILQVGLKAGRMVIGISNILLSFTCVMKSSCTCNTHFCREKKDYWVLWLQLQFISCKSDSANHCLCSLLLCRSIIVPLSHYFGSLWKVLRVHNRGFTIIVVQEPT